MSSISSVILSVVATWKSLILTEYRVEIQCSRMLIVQHTILHYVNAFSSSTLTPFFSVEFKLTVNYLEIVIFSDTWPLLYAIISIFADVLLILELFPVENINCFDK